MSQRPTGVTVISVLQTIGALLLVLIAGLFFFLAAHGTGGREVAALEVNGEALPQSTVLMGFGSGFLVLALFNLGVSIGLFLLKGWAWLMTLVLQGVNVLLSLGLIVSGFSRGSSVFSVVVAGVIIYYLLKPNVKQSFGK